MTTTVDHGKSPRTYRISSLVQKSVFASVLAGLGALVLLFWYIAAGPIDFFATSLVLVALCALVTYWFSPISVQSLIFLSVYIPSLAFLWAKLSGAEYINAHNHWLQNIPYFVNSSVYLALCASLLSFSVLAMPTLSKKTHRSVNKVSVGISLPLYVFCALASGFFFWLTDPSFATIITHSYTYILADRIPNTQFAGGVAVIFWLGALVNYLRLTEPRCCCGSGERLTNRLFVLVTLFSIIWLALHARRSELVGMALVILVVLRSRIGFQRTFILGLVFLTILIVAGEIRGGSLLVMLSGSEQTGRTDIAKMPGGASNVFMTFVNALHYFDINDYFYGETFLNYVRQIAPRFIYDAFDISKPDYFYALVFSGNYSYNGGTHVIAVFFGNFGLLGVVLVGLSIGLYARVARALIVSSGFVEKIIGFYMLAFAFRGFWYELITIIKPILVVLVPGLVVFYALRTLQRSKRALP